MVKSFPVKLLLVVAFVLAFTALSIKSKHLVEEGDRASAAENNAMLNLAAVARLMIAEGGNGVRGTDDHRYIASFSSFFEFVARVHPQAVVQPDAPNPFPLLLPGKSYTRLRGLAQSGADVLICSEPRERHFKTITNYLRCDGTAGDDVK